MKQMGRPRLKRNLNECQLKTFNEYFKNIEQELSEIIDMLNSSIGKNEKTTKALRASLSKLKRTRDQVNCEAYILNPDYKDILMIFEQLSRIEHKIEKWGDV